MTMPDDDLRRTCAAITENASLRRAALQSIQSLNSQQLALARRASGFSTTLPEKDRAKISATAAKMVKAITKGEGYLDHPTALLILAAEEAVQPFAQRRAKYEKELEILSRTLPVASFVEGIRGFGFPGLALIVGEAGNLSSYPNPAKLWKRLGLAVIGGASQRRSTNAEEAAIQGYNPKRRSVVWNIGDSLLKSQIRAVVNKAGEKTEKRVALGEYGQIYLDRKAYELARPKDETKSPMHAHRKAQRYMEKRLILNLWKAWRSAVGVVEAPVAAPVTPPVVVEVKPVVKKKPKRSRAAIVPKNSNGGRKSRTMKAAA